MEDHVGNILRRDISNEKYEMYQEFCKLTVYHKLLSERHQEVVEEKQRFNQKLDILNETLLLGTLKRFRRNADQIKRIFLCVYCNKSYGSEASLKNHLKLKHSSHSSGN